MNDKDRQQILTFKKLESENFWHLSFKRDKHLSELTKKLHE